jgi:anti-sigma B factor antagonist
MTCHSDVKCRSDSAAFSSRRLVRGAAADVDASGLTVRYFDGIAVVTLPAEIDLTNASLAGGTLLTVLNRGASGVIADMSGTSFCDAAGVRAIVRAHQRALLLDSWLRVIITHHAVWRTFRLVGADSVLRIYPALDSALAGLGDEPDPPSTAPPTGPPDRPPDHPPGGRGGHGRRTASSPLVGALGRREPDAR